MPNPTPGADPERRGVQFIGIGSNGSLVLAILFLQPQSRGSIEIQSKDPLKIVLAGIDPAYRLISPTLDVIDDEPKLEEFIKQNFGHNHHH